MITSKKLQNFEERFYQVDKLCEEWFNKVFNKECQNIVYDNWCFDSGNRLCIRYTDEETEKTNLTFVSFKELEMFNKENTEVHD